MSWITILNRKPATGRKSSGKGRKGATLPPPFSSWLLFKIFNDDIYVGRPFHFAIVAKFRKSASLILITQHRVWDVFFKA